MAGLILAGAAIGAAVQDPFENPLSAIFSSGVGALMGAHLKMNTPDLTFKHSKVIGPKVDIGGDPNNSKLRKKISEWVMPDPSPIPGSEESISASNGKKFKKITFKRYTQFDIESKGGRFGYSFKGGLWQYKRNMKVAELEARFNERQAERYKKFLENNPLSEAKSSPKMTSPEDDLRHNLRAAERLFSLNENSLPFSNVDAAADLADERHLTAMKFALDATSEGKRLNLTELGDIDPRNVANQGQGMELRFKGSATREQMSARLTKYFVKELGYDTVSAKQEVDLIVDGIKDNDLSELSVRDQNMRVKLSDGSRYNFPLTAIAKDSAGNPVGRYTVINGKTYAVQQVALNGREVARLPLELGKNLIPQMQDFTSPEASLGKLTDMPLKERLEAAQKISSTARQYMPIETAKGWIRGKSGRMVLDGDNLSTQFRAVASHVNYKFTIDKNKEGAQILRKTDLHGKSGRESEFAAIVKRYEAAGINPLKGMTISSNGVLSVGGDGNFTRSNIIGAEGRDADINIRAIVPHRARGGGGTLADTFDVSKLVISDEDIEFNAKMFDGLAIGDGAGLVRRSALETMGGTAYEVLDFGNPNVALIDDESLGGYIKALASRPKGQSAADFIEKNSERMITGNIGYNASGTPIGVGRQYSYATISDAWFDGDSLKVGLTSEYIPTENVKIFGPDTKGVYTAVDDDKFDEIVRTFSNGSSDIKSVEIIQVSSGSGTPVFSLDEFVAKGDKHYEELRHQMFDILTSNSKASSGITNTLRTSSKLTDEEKVRLSSVIDSYTQDADIPGKFKENNEFLESMIAKHYEKASDFQRVTSIVNVEAADSVLGMGNASTLSWNQQLMLNQKGISMETIRALGTRNNEALYELDLLTSSLRSSGESYQTELYDDKGMAKMLRVLSAEPENRLTIAADEFTGVDPSSDRVSYNLTDPPGKIRSVHLATVSTDRSGIFDTGTSQVVKTLDKAKIELIEADMNYRKYIGADSEVVAPFREARDEALRRYEQSVVEAMSGDNNLYKESFRITPHKSAQAKARPMMIADDAEFDKIKHRVYINRSSLGLYLEGNLDDIEYTTDGEVYRKIKGKNKGKDTYSKVNIQAIVSRQPDFGPGSSYLADVYVIKDKPGTIEGQTDAYVPVNKRMETHRGKFQFQDFDADALHIYPLSKLTKEQTEEVVTAMQRTSGHLDSIGEVFDNLSVKGSKGGETTAAELMVKAMNDGTSYAEELLSEHIVDQQKAMARQTNSAAAASLSLGFQNAIHKQSEITGMDEKLKVASGMIAHAFTENIIKTKHLTKEDFEAGKGNVASNLMALKRKYLEEGSAHHEKNYRKGLLEAFDTSMGGILSSGGVSEESKKIYSEAVENIVSSEMTWAKRLATENIMPIDSNASVGGNTAESLLSNAANGIENSPLLERNYAEGPDLDSSVKKVKNSAKDAVTGFLSANKRPLLLGAGAMAATAFMLGSDARDIPLKSLPVRNQQSSSAETLPPMQQSTGHIAKERYSQGKNISMKVRSQNNNSDHKTSMTSAIFGNGVRSANVYVHQ